MKPWKGVAPILAGRWQIPLALCAAVVAGVALYQMKPPKRAAPFDALLADVLALAEAGAYHDAADAAANLLERRPPLPRRVRANLHDALANTIYRQELVRGLPNRKNAELLLQHHEAALACGRSPNGHTALRAGQAHEWLGETPQAVNAYRAVLERNASPDVRRTALQGLVRLLEGQPQHADERRRCIQTLLDEEGVSPGYLWWVLRHAVQEALAHDDTARARELLTRHGQRLKRSDLKGYHDYLWAWVYTHDGQTEAAEPLIERVDQWLAGNPQIDAEMDRAGFLPALSRWLRGRIHLAEGRPQAALESFSQALALQSHGDVLVMTTIGRAQAFGLLQRHEAARLAVRDTVARLAADQTTLSVGRPRLRQTLEQLLNTCHQERDYENALAYLDLALELTPEDEPELRLDLLERLGLENAEAAEFASEQATQRVLHANAACAYEQAAELARLDEPRYASLLWAGATQFDYAGRTGDARRLLTHFVAGRSFDPRMPQALLHLGQACAVDSCLEEAIEYYQRLAASYPRLEEATRARLLIAHSLIALGPEHYAEAERILRDLLEDEHLAPRARVFRDALFELCDLCYQQEKHAQAISYLEDFLAFYPDDLECFRARFMLADVYRRSAHALRENQAAGPQAARERVSRERFQRAAELFGAFVDDVGSLPSDQATQVTYQRLALLYHGDCLFALNEPGTLEEALVTYRRAAARYQGEPAALTAQVQIANIYLRQGKLTEAARAVERARWLLRNIPDAAFAECGDGLDRASWDRFLDVVRSSSLFQNVLAGTQ